MSARERHLILVGMMGSGKSTVGKRCAERLQRPLVDTDEVVASLAGVSVSEVFTRDGEAAFRELEREAVADACAAPVPAVIAAGGGAVLDPENRKRMHGAGLVVWLQAPPALLAARVGDGRGRPLLRGDPVATLERLDTLRRPAYEAAADDIVDTTSLPVGAVVDAVLERFAERVSGQPEGQVSRVTVDLGARAYDIVVGDGALAELGVVLSGRRRAAIVTQDAVRDHAARVAAVLERSGVENETFTMGDGEEHKTLATVEALAGACASWGLLRGDAIVAVGGGIVGDVGGFVAASYHRGIAVVQVPTTLLAMVDASIGGKTGVNLPQGKNLVGAFHQPLAVLAEPAVLATLPEREFRCGLAEVAKYALSGDDELLRLLLDHGSELVGREPAVVATVVARCAAAKARVVEADELERTGARAVLNYGHTLAHALEIAGGHTVRHGEAVSIGLVFAATLATVLERVGPDVLDAHERLLQGFGLPVEAPPGLSGGEVLALMRRDKKAEGGLTFMLQGPRGVERVDNPDPTAVAKALAQVGVTEAVS
jgi:shikimate kinase / 3-dehydroquinate synthase